MEELPRTTFGRTLRSLVRERWGTQGRFAEVLSVDTSWVTKVIRGDQESLAYASLQKLLAGFERPSDREALYEAWIETYAPSPLGAKAPDPWASDEAILAYAEGVSELISAGRAPETFRELRLLWQALKERTPCSPATLAVGQALIDVANQLDRIPASLQVGRELRELAIRAQEPGWVARALWLQSVTLRLVRPRALLVTERSFALLHSYLGHWQPISPEARRERDGLVHSCSRDLVLSGLDALAGPGGESPNLAGRVETLRNKLGELECPSEIGIGSEVLARALVAMNRVDEAIGPLREAGRLASSRPNQLKVQICRIQLLAAGGQVQEAQGSLEQAMDFADTFRLVHHRHKLAVLERRLTVGSGRYYSCP